MFTTLAATILYGSSLVSLGSAAAIAPRDGCPTLHTIVMRGRYQPVGSDWYDLVRGTAALIDNTVSGADSYGLPYDAGNYDQVAGLTNGSIVLQNYVKNYIATCPSSKIGIIGFSDGAVAVSNAICGSTAPYGPVFPMNPDFTSNVVATVVWGDLTKPANAPWLKGTCPADRIGYTPRVITSTCAPYSDSLVSYCDTGDKYCCGSTDTSNNAHGSYQNHYAQSTSDFIVNAYKASTA